MSVKEVNSSNFNEEVLASKMPVIVDFWAPWCGPCHAIAPIVEEISDEFAESLSVCKLNIDENMELAVKYGVSGIPSLLFFKNGDIEGKSVGVRSKGDILNEFGLSHIPK